MVEGIGGMSRPCLVRQRMLSDDEYTWLLPSAWDGSVMLEAYSNHQSLPLISVSSNAFLEKAHRGIHIEEVCTVESSCPALKSRLANQRQAA